MVHGAAGARHDRKEAQELVAFVVRGVLELGMCEKRVKNAEVGMAEGASGEGKIEEVADDNVDKDAEVVGVKVFIG